MLKYFVFDVYYPYLEHTKIVLDLLELRFVIITVLYIDGDQLFSMIKEI